MRSFLPSSRRLLALVGGAAAGLLAVGLLASPASACNSTLQPANCVNNDKQQVQFEWSVDEPGAITKATINPSAGLTFAKNEIVTDAKFTKGQKLVTIATVPAGTASVTLVVEAYGIWNNTHIGVNQTKTVSIPASCGGAKDDNKCQPCQPGCGNTDGCKPPCDASKGECPKPPCDASKGECPKPPCDASKGECTTPCKEDGGKGHCPASSAPASASVPPAGVGGGAATAPSMSEAANTLPTTGANTGVVVGAALLLLGAGAAVFILARRRQVRFTA